MGDSPAAILFDVNGNPVGTVIDGVFYRLQVEAKLAAGTNTIGSVNQGTSPWTVDGTVAVSNMPQLTVETKLAVDNYDLNSALYTVTIPFVSDALLSSLEMRFSTTESRTISISLNDGTILFSEVGNTLFLLGIDFEDYAIDSGTVLTITVSQTSGACLLDVTLTSKTATTSLGDAPVIGAGTAHIGSVSIDIGGNTGDAFGRLRVANPQSLIEINHIYDLSPKLMGLSLHDAGTTITHSSPAAILTVPNTSGRKIIHESHIYTTYLPGKSHLIRMTGQLDDGFSISGMGYGDNFDGIFLENQDGDLQIRFISSTIPGQLIKQENWNIDTLDGYGKSAILFNKTTAVQLLIDFSWLGVGRVRVGFDIGGNVIYVHEFLFSNSQPTAYMRTGSLPIRWYLESTGVIASMKAICAVVTSEGGSDPFGFPFSVALKTQVGTYAIGVRRPVISIRPKTTFNSLENNIQVILDNITFLSSTSDNLLIEIVRDGSLTGASWVSVHSESHVEYDESATDISGGQIVYSDYISTQGRVLNAASVANLKTLPLTLYADGTAGLFTICVVRIAGAANVFAGFNWREVL